MLRMGLHFDWANYVIFATCFMPKCCDTHIAFLQWLFLVWHDWWFALWCKSIFLTSFAMLSSSLQLNKGFMLFNFLPSSFLIYWKRFSFVGKCDGFLQCFCHAGPSSLVFLQDVKFSWIVIHRSKFWRMALLQLKLKLLSIWRTMLWVSQDCS